MLIGITGTISSGKSTVAAYLRKRQFRVIDADKLAHDELLNDEVVADLTERFGEHILDGNKIDRKKLGQIVFHNSKERAFLNNLIHPRVISKIKDFKKSNELVFVEVPLLYESNIESLFDKIIVVFANKKTLITRLMKRDAISQKYAKRKIASQMDIEDKKNKADYTIDNSGDMTNTYCQIEVILRRLT